MTRLQAVRNRYPGRLGGRWPDWSPRATGCASSCSCTAAVFGVTDPQFGKDLGFYAFDLPFYRLVLN